MSLSLNMKFKTLKLVHTSSHFGIFIYGISFFSNEEFDSSNDNEIDFENWIQGILKSVTDFEIEIMDYLIWNFLRKLNQGKPSFKSTVTFDLRKTKMEIESVIVN